jgi:hypothetical protein
MALLLCLFVSSVEYLPQDHQVSQTEQNAQNPDQTFLSVAVDAVVPFAVQVGEITMHLIYQVFQFEFQLPKHHAVSAFIPNQLIEILFEQIISTQAP